MSGMRQSKLYQAIIRLSGHELNRLHRFILSPYFNRNDAILHLFEWIKSDLKGDQKDEITKEDLWFICFEKSEKFKILQIPTTKSTQKSKIDEYVQRIE